MQFRTLEGQIIKIDRPFVTGGIQYPSNWIRLANQDEIDRIGLVEIDPPVRIRRKRWEGRPLSEIKTELLALIKAKAGTKLLHTDWYVMRFMETGTPIPPEVVALRAKIRQDCDETEAAIQGARTKKRLEERFYPKAAGGIE